MEGASPFRVIRAVAPTDADNPAVRDDWRICDADFCVARDTHDPTTNAGYTTAVTSQKPHYRSVSCRLGKSIFNGLDVTALLALLLHRRAPTLLPARKVELILVHEEGLDGLFYQALKVDDNVCPR